MKPLPTSPTTKYVPGRSIAEISEQYNIPADAIIKLGSNENPLGPAPSAVRAIIKHANNVSIYPDSDASALCDALSGYTGYPGANIVASAGMDGVIDTMMRMLMPGEAIIPVPTFSYYGITARTHHGTPVFVSRDENFGLDPQAILSQVTNETRVIFLCSPNNPSGNLVSESDLRTILAGCGDCNGCDGCGAVVFLDEAYIEFSERSMIHLVREYDNLMVGRTLSKAFGLAGLRVGYAVMPEKMRDEYLRYATPFSVSSLATAAGIAALGDDAHLKQSVKLVRDGRKVLMEIPFKVYPSEANFVLVDVSPHQSGEVCELLAREGIIVRDCSSFRGAGDTLVRVSVGTPEQNERVVEAFSEFKSCNVATL
ncbi:MAG: histidinol-phosphate aminotransferase [Candidatus Methanogaster sp.]|nr:MAG: histidinol-phosphate aminotransferase [ANME-2 cluster archaeon]